MCDLSLEIWNGFGVAEGEKEQNEISRKQGHIEHVQETGTWSRAEAGTCWSCLWIGKRHKTEGS